MEKASAVLTIQRSYRLHRARKQFDASKRDILEERAWRLSLVKRRERIQRLERELRYLEDLPAEDVSRQDLSDESTLLMQLIFLCLLLNRSSCCCSL